MFRISACLLSWAFLATATLVTVRNSSLNSNGPARIPGAPFRPWTTVSPFDAGTTLPGCTKIRTDGYGYKRWYNADDTSGSGGNGTALLKFYVQAKENANIMLSSFPFSAAYEIVIGSEQNTFSSVRKASGPRSLSRTRTPNILNASRPVGFWIRVTHGLIEVSKMDESMPFISWTDPNPVPVKYFSFSSWYMTYCEWQFQCKSDAEQAAKDKSGRKDHADKFLTNMERLRRDVLKQRSKSGTGNPASNGLHPLKVAITGNFEFIHLDVMTSVLTLRGYATFEWTDDGIGWNPRDYANISKLHLANYELWRPELVLHNSLDPAASLFSEAKISVTNEGRVVWNPKFDMTTKCPIDLKSWPWDRHKCTLTMSSWSHKIANVVYEIAQNKSSKRSNVRTHSDWRLDWMSSSYAWDDRTPWDDVVKAVSDDDDEYDIGFRRLSLQLNLAISRNTKIFEKLFYTPLLLISCLWLSSFCVMPNASSKITIICISIILSTSIMVYMTTYVPVYVESPPDLLLGYLWLMLLMSTDAFVSSLLIAAHDRKTTAFARASHPPFALTRLLTAPLVTRLLALPRLEYEQPPDPVAVDGDGRCRRDRPAAVVTLWDVVIVAFGRAVFATYVAVTLIVLQSSVGLFTPF